MPQLYYEVPAGESLCTCGAPIAWVKTRSVDRFPLDLEHRHPTRQELARPHWPYCKHASAAQKAQALAEADLGRRPVSVDFQERSERDNEGGNLWD